MRNLKDSFKKALQAANGVTNNPYLVSLEEAVKEISDAFQVDSVDSVLSEYNQKLLNISSENNFSLDPKKTNEFAQLLGEAQFYLFCKKRGVNLKRIKERGKKAPDFKCVDNDIFFEVKTLSVVSGAFGINKSLENALEAQIDIENQLRNGKKIASSTYVVQPYGEKPYQKGKGKITAVIETLVEKTKQNLKRGQFSNGNGTTFLVLNLSIIPPFRTENFVLRPAYCDDYQFTKCVSGELWMLAFAQPGMFVLGVPEFEGKPCVESIMNLYGVLADQNYKFVDGILFMIHPWQRNIEIWGIFSYDNYMYWNDNKPYIVNTLNSIVGNNWNDDKDSNGWRLNGLNGLSNMRDFRIAVGNSLSDKLGEFGFFLKQIVDVAMAIERKHLHQKYPINDELNQLNYYFSAYLNTIQALKDSFKTATDIDLSWNYLSPTYGKFIFYCRNATTHDGSHLISGGKGGKCYIAGPLRRIDGNGKLIEFDPPQKDICTLCCDISKEVLANLRRALNRDDVNIPSVDEINFKKSILESLNGDFIPPEIRTLIKANQHSIEKSFEGIKIDVTHKIFDAIASVDRIVADVCICL